MGEIILLSDTMPDLLPSRHRSPGVHVSSVIHHLCVKLGIFATTGPTAERMRGGGGGANAPQIGDDDYDYSWMQLGKALEFAIVQQIELDAPGRYMQPGELCKDNIYGTPDLVDINDHAIEEVKLSWMSVDNDVAGVKFWRYWVQIMCYCWMWETYVGRLRVVHVNGDWRGAGPQYRLWEQRFTHQELAENWALIKSHAALLR